ncbi:hypothetical protein EVAR_22350_1 [Eumeta japonica]|uniref:Nucleic-acid-binding protein from transposon X-element n=1 Tax=Eumeta variegata TaxID=151549 RepID=A0A4C1VJK3_EUMVA|nr:hypothetical protein EVAR_22350_1 [Eumeta japonica]
MRQSPFIWDLGGRFRDKGGRPRSNENKAVSKAISTEEVTIESPAFPDPFALEEATSIPKRVIADSNNATSIFAPEDSPPPQEYSIHEVHRMHRRNGIALDLALVILQKNDMSREIFKTFSKVCGLFGIIMEAPYKRGIPGQCNSCQLYGHAAVNCHAQPRCVK